MEHTEFDVSRETADRLHAFEQLVRQWTKRINLISRGDLGVIWQRHVLDCVQLVPLLPPNSDGIIDLGSGAGFPGIVLAIVTGLPVVLIDSDQRKAAFLRTAVAILNIEATILCGRIENLNPSPASLVTARALAPLPSLLELAVPKLAKGGSCLFMKGKNVETELTEALQEWHMNVERFASRTAPDATIFRLSEISRVTKNEIHTRK